jgi:membrane protein
MPITLKTLRNRLKNLWVRFAHTSGWNVVKNSFLLFQKHDTSTQSAALSYYTIFSIAPMLLIVISLAGIFLGRDAVEGVITSQLSKLISPDSAKAIQSVIKSAYRPGENWLYTALAILLLVLGATAVFGQLRTALNTIWNVKPSAKTRVARFFITKVFSIAMIGALAFLLLVSLVAQSVLMAFTRYLSRYMTDFSVIMIKAVDIIMSLAVTTILFAMIYRYMSDARPKWRTVFAGSLFTTILFSLGKYAIGLYLGQSNFTTTYGASGSIILLIVWVFYSSQIVFFGAEFTRALAIQNGILLDPKAIESNEKVGIVTSEKKVLDTDYVPAKKLTRKIGKKKQL